MRYQNYLLFSHSFLTNFLRQSDTLLAVDFVRQSAMDWYGDRKTTDVTSMVNSWIRPLLLMQDLILTSADREGANSYYLSDPDLPDKPISVCYVAPYGVPLDGWNESKWISKGQHWMAKTVRAAKRLSLRSVGQTPITPWAILTNGQQWRILKTNHLRKYEAYMEVDLHSLMLHQDDPLAAVLFKHFFSREAFVPDAQGVCRLDQWLAQSEKTTEDVEEHLRKSVSDNLDTPGDSDGIMAQLCMGMVQSISQQTFTDKERGAIYRDASYLLYRLLFILYAESRELLPTHLPEYQTISLDNILNIVQQKIESPIGDLLKDSSVWKKLQTLFSAIRESNTALGVPKYNGGLFDDDDKPNLRECVLTDAFLVPALFELAYIRGEDGGFKRIDYRDLSVRHLGSLYEGMIEYKLFVATEPLYARRDKNDRVSYLPASSTKKETRDELIPRGHVYFAQSPTERRATGTHYTPEDLVQRLVDQTVLRLLNERWREFQKELKPWLDEAEKSVNPTLAKLQAHIDQMIIGFIRDYVLTMHICDPAMGSGHFLVHAAHRITDFILEKLAEIDTQDEEINLHPDFWRRQVVESCLYGVDVNEMAVELAKLSLWLATMTLGKPLSFLDHHLVEGNSLVSTSLEEISRVLSADALTPLSNKGGITGLRQMMLSEAPGMIDPLEKAKQLLEEIRAMVVETASDVKAQELDYEEEKDVLSPYRLIADLIAARRFGWRIKDNEFVDLAIAISNGEETRFSQNEKVEAGLSALGSVSPIHWELSFLDVFMKNTGLSKPGFDVVIGNPPYLGGRRISTELGDRFLRYLKAAFVPSFGLADLCAYLLRQGYDLLRGDPGRFIGFVTTNTLSQGDTRRTGLAVTRSAGGRIVYAERFIPWKGDATVEVNLIVIKITTDLNDDLESEFLLDGRSVPSISSYLDDLPEGDPAQLIQNSGRSFLGDTPMGNGFFIESGEADQLLRKNAINADCLLPFLTGSDLNRMVEQKPSRYVICFRDMSLQEAEAYPDLLEIVQARVKPYRDKVKRHHLKSKWWLFADYRRKLRIATKEMNRVLVRGEVSENHMLVFASNDYVLDHKLIVFAYDDWYHFGVLQSGVHDVWLRRQSSTMRTDISYTPTDCFRTFPFPQSMTESSKVNLDVSSQKFYESRQTILENRQIGLTTLYNLFHKPTTDDADILFMRKMSAEMDSALMACFGWTDLDPQYGFYSNARKKVRFGIDLDTQREIFIRLLQLNQLIAAREASEGVVPIIEDEADEESDHEEF